MGNFCTRKLTFSSRKLVLFVKKMPFNVQCKTFITIRNDKKIVLCFSQDFLAFGPFLGFFWPSEGLRPPSGQKNPKNGPQAKKPGCSTNFFLSFLMLILSCISTLKYTQTPPQSIPRPKSRPFFLPFWPFDHNSFHMVNSM